MLTVPQHPWLWSQNDEHGHHVRRYQAQELKKKVEEAGFQVVKMTSFVSLLLPLMILSRWRQRKPQPEYDTMSEFRIGRLTNVLLESVQNVERGIIRAGVSLPVGGSLLVVGKKL